jgi:hypothetical protein
VDQLFLRDTPRREAEKAETILLPCGPNSILGTRRSSLDLTYYAGVMGRLEEAKARLQCAIELEKEIRRLALDDEDLKTFWDWIAPASANSGTIQSLLVPRKAGRGALVTF